MICIFNEKSLEKFLMLKPEQLENVEHLEVLKLNEWFFTENIEQLTRLKHIIKQSSITEFSLRNANVQALSDEAFQVFCDMVSECQDLKKVHFFAETLNKLPTQRLAMLMKALHYCPLKEVSLEGNHIGDWDNGRLTILGKGLLSLSHRGLQVIHLGSNEIHKLNLLGCQTLFGFLSVSAITELYLDGNKIGLSRNGHCLIELAGACAQIENLKLLHLGDNNLDGLRVYGFNEFFHPLSKSRISTLDLRENGLGNANLPHQYFIVLGKTCGAFKNLRTLSLARNKWSQLEDPCFSAFETGLMQSNTLVEIEGIHSFSAARYQALNEILLRNKNWQKVLTKTRDEKPENQKPENPTAENEDSEKENRPIENTLEKQPGKRVCFVHGNRSQSALGFVTQKTSSDVVQPKRRKLLGQDTQ